MLDANKYGTTVDKLRTLNPKVNPNSLQIGQKLVLSGSTVTYHTVVKGNTVSALAEKYGSSIKNIKSWNELGDNNMIYAGQSLRVI
ncbi:LysM peptidoglycan-binding domain-containing protein [Peribacillus frigoritolerans]|uniref:LysM peptidoglycan-binding domain-containing protein n=1 Tax=Peribacillus frigoritolerans TaxID=450367 RepID=UPI00380DF5B3